MTFTLVSHLREEIGLLIREKIELEKKIEAEKERIAFEVLSYHFQRGVEAELQKPGRREAHAWHTCDLGIF